ncbi:Acetylcholine receptor subunit beta-like 2, partial [Folsomia candida]
LRGDITREQTRSQQTTSSSSGALVCTWAELRESIAVVIVVVISNYNPLIRPVANDSDRVAIKLGLKLSQIIDVNMKNQILTTNVWVEQMWIDYKLVWDPDNYGGTKELYIPSEKIWCPDIVLFNNADGNYQPNTMAKATIHFTGLIVLTLPAIYKSFCEINVEYFPFDEQTCFLRFGSWTFDGNEVDLQHLFQESDSDVVQVGIDLTEFHLSVEWDLLEVPCRRNVETYPCCDEPYIDLTFNITIRRKMMFYTVNLIVPTVIICFLTVLVFYLPSDSGEKIALSINILVSLSWFFLLLDEIIPPTSLAIPLIGKYLLFTFLLVVTSVFLTVGVLSVHFKGSSSQKMPPWVLFNLKFVFFDINVGRVTDFSPVNIRRPLSDLDFPRQRRIFENLNKRVSPEVLSAIESAEYLAQHISKQIDKTKEIDDWKYVAMVLDRLFLWIFTLTCCCGTVWIILLAPSLTDARIPIDQELSRDKHMKWT